MDAGDDVTGAETALNYGSGEDVDNVFALALDKPRWVPLAAEGQLGERPVGILDDDLARAQLRFERAQRLREARVFDGNVVPRQDVDVTLDDSIDTAS